MECSSGFFGHQTFGDPQQKKKKKTKQTNKQKKPLRMGWYLKLRERKLGGGGGGKYDLKAASTSWPYPIVIVFSPLVGERGHRGPRVVDN